MAGQRAVSGIEVDDANFLRTLTTAFAALKIESEAQLEKVAYGVANRAKMFCPVASGTLKSSIDKSDLMRDAQGAYVTVGTPVVYAKFVEFGTFKMRAQPFLRPALAEASGGAFGIKFAPGRIGKWGDIQMSQASYLGVSMPGSASSVAA